MNMEDNNNDNFNNMNDNSIFNDYIPGRFIIIKCDKTYIAIELISYLIILLIAIVAFLYGTNSTFFDPIASVKSNFLIGQLICIGITILATVLASFFTKSSKENLITYLRIIAIASIIISIIFVFIKINYNSNYNENTFEQYYEQYEKQKDPKEERNNLNIGISGLSIVDSKTSYIEQSKSSYTTFTIKSSLYIALQILIGLIIFYLSYRLSSMEKKKNNVTKDDAVLFDNETNVKY